MKQSNGYSFATTCHTALLIENVDFKPMNHEEYYNYLIDGFMHRLAKEMVHEDSERPNTCSASSSY